MPDPSADRAAAIFSGAHPLARRLSEALRPGERAIVVGDGSGRNSRALEAAGLRVAAIPDERSYTQLEEPSRTFDGGLSTHAYLHGTSAKIRAGIVELARVLQPGAPAFLTLGSFEDVRYGFGDRIDENTFAPGDGPEIGVPHAYFDRDGVLDVMRPFSVLSLEEVGVDEIVGTWAHLDEEPLGKIHWFVAARKLT